MALFAFLDEMELQKKQREMAQTKQYDEISTLIANGDTSDYWTQWSLTVEIVDLLNSGDNDKLMEVYDMLYEFSNAPERGEFGIDFSPNTVMTCADFLGLHQYGWTGCGCGKCKTCVNSVDVSHAILHAMAFGYEQLFEEEARDETEQAKCRSIIHKLGNGTVIGVTSFGMEVTFKHGIGFLAAGLSRRLKDILEAMHEEDSEADDYPEEEEYEAEDMPEDEDQVEALHQRRMMTRGC
jgi:hypothetical protein